MQGIIKNTTVNTHMYSDWESSVPALDQQLFVCVCHELSESRSFVFTLVTYSKQDLFNDDRYHHKKHCFMVISIIIFFYDDIYHHKRLFYDDIYHHKRIPVFMMISISIKESFLCLMMISIIITEFLLWVG